MSSAVPRPMAGGLLETVTRETICEDEVLNFRMRPQNRVLIEGIIGVMSNPRIDQLDPLECGDAVAMAGQTFSSQIV